jgi:hypothetical protein
MCETEMKKSPTETMIAWKALLDDAIKQVENECRTIDDLKRLMDKHGVTSGQAIFTEARSRCDFATMTMRRATPRSNDHAKDD